MKNRDDRRYNETNEFVFIKQLGTTDPVCINGKPVTRLQLLKRYRVALIGRYWSFKPGHKMNETIRADLLRVVVNEIQREEALA